jgi:hypothetical protein
MKRTARSSKRRATSSTTSTVGPHTRLEQYLGVEKVTTKGMPARRVSATECSRRISSGGVRVVTFDASFPTLASVGVSDAGAASPGPGSGSSLETTTLPSACTFLLPPSGSAMIQYVPGFGSCTRAT